MYNWLHEKEVYANKYGDGKLMLVCFYSSKIFYMKLLYKPTIKIPRQALNVTSERNCHLTNPKCLRRN